jgi:hypothetical protein
MSDELKQFIMGLGQSTDMGGMYWYGSVPKEVYELFQLNPNDGGRQRLNVLGVHVEVRPRYEVFTPEWKKREA